MLSQMFPLSGKAKSTVYVSHNTELHLVGQMITLHWEQEYPWSPSYLAAFRMSFNYERLLHI